MEQRCKNRNRRKAVKCELNVWNRNASLEGQLFELVWHLDRPASVLIFAEASNLS